MNRWKTTWVALLLCLTALILVGTAIADEFRLLPSVALRQEYNDNIFFTIDDIVHDSITTVSPGLVLVRKTERVDFSLLARIDQRLYWAHSDLNATDQTYNGSLRYTISPRFRLTGRAGYIEDSSPDRDVETTGLVLTPATRRRQVYGATGEYSLTDKTVATLAYDYSKDEWTSLSFIDIESNAVNLGLIHDLSYLTNATKARANLGLAHYSYTGQQIDNFTGTVGLSRQLSELWNLSADAGLRYSRSSTDVTTTQFIPPFTLIATPQTEKSQDMGWIAQVGLTYRGEKTNADITFVHDLLPASGYVGAAERTGLSLSMTRRLTYELSGTCSASYYLNKTDQGQFSAQTIDQQLLSINLGLRYEVTRDVAVEGSYSFIQVQYRNTNQEADRNLLMVRLILQHALFE